MTKRLSLQSQTCGYSGRTVQGTKHIGFLNCGRNGLTRRNWWLSRGSSGSSCLSKYTLERERRFTIRGRLVKRAGCGRCSSRVKRGLCRCRCLGTSLRVWCLRIDRCLRNTGHGRRLRRKGCARVGDHFIALCGLLVQFRLPFVKFRFEQR